MRLVRTRPEDFAVSPKLSGRVCKSSELVRSDGRRTVWKLQLVRTRPDAIANLQSDRTSLTFFFQNTFNYTSASELVRTSLQLVRIHSLTVDGWVGVCIFAWQSSGRNRNFFELSGGRTSADEFEIRPNSARRVYSLKISAFNFRRPEEFAVFRN